VIESFVPASVAVAEPRPVMSALVFASTGTGNNRTLYVSGACAASGRAHPMVSASNALMIGQYTPGHSPQFWANSWSQLLVSFDTGDSG